jgi:hypothetical protein
MELRNWHFLSNVNWIIKAGHIAGMGKTRKAQKFWYTNMKESDHLKDIDRNVSI